MTGLPGLSHGMNWFFGLRIMSSICNSLEARKTSLKTMRGVVWSLWAEGPRRLEWKMIGEGHDWRGT